MRKNLSLAFCLSLLSILFITSCGEDDAPGGGGVAIPPSISLLAEAGYISADANAGLTDTLRFRIKADRGDADLNAITVLEDGAALPGGANGRLIFPHISDEPSSANNPQVIVGADGAGLTWDVFILNPGAAGNYVYNFEVVDKDQQTDNISVSVTIIGNPPVINYSGGADIIVGTNQLVAIAVDVVAGDGRLQSIGVRENGTLMDANRLRYNSPDMTAEFGANPLDFPEADKDGFNGTIYIRSSIDNSNKTYTIEVTDEASQVTSIDINFLAGTLIDGTFPAELLSNADGPSSVFGGLDLSVPDSVPANSPLADIVDLGIDINKLPADNWLQKFKPANGAELRVPAGFQPETFDFDAFTIKEQIIELYNAGTEITETDVVAVDDIFIVKSGEDYFLLKITAVNVTTADNRDSYEMTVKQALE
ncbi:MAG: hypothetical protein AAFV95_05680 [Bacteroidota bacterium]